MKMMLLQTASDLQHPPSVFYMGVFNLHGHGCTVNYDMALNYFMKASLMGDLRVTAEAEREAENLKRLLDHARRENEAVIDMYSARNELRDF